MAQEQLKLAIYKAHKLALGGFLASATVASLTCAGPVLADGPDPVELLSTMSQALKDTTYRGTFVHFTDGHVESMSMLHSRQGEVMRERMTSLNGEAREVYRNNSLVTCIWPGSRSVIVSKSKPRDLLPKVNETLIRSQHYAFVTEVDDRVAGRAAYVVSVAPKDDYRYGYRFWIDQTTHVMLRYMLLDNTGKSLEQVMFTDISFPTEIAVSELEPNAESRDGYSWVEPAEKGAVGGENRINFAALPAGYQEISERYEPMPMSDSAVSHIMVSDGMASVSIYVEYGTADSSGGEAESDVSRMGALNAYGRAYDKAYVTVVGEVPAETVRKIGDAVEFVAVDN